MPRSGWVQRGDPERDRYMSQEDGGSIGLPADAADGRSGGAVEGPAACQMGMRSNAIACSGQWSQPSATGGPGLQGPAAWHDGGSCGPRANDISHRAKLPSGREPPINSSGQPRHPTKAKASTLRKARRPGVEQSRAEQSRDVALAAFAPPRLRHGSITSNRNRTPSTPRWRSSSMSSTGCTVS